MMYIVTQTLWKKNPNSLCGARPSLGIREWIYIYVVLNGRSDYQVLHFFCLKQDLGIQTHFHLIYNNPHQYCLFLHWQRSLDDLDGLETWTWPLQNVINKGHCETERSKLGTKPGDFRKYKDSFVFTHSLITKIS